MFGNTGLLGRHGVREYKVFGNGGRSELHGVREYKVFGNTGCSGIHGVREYRVFGNTGCSGIRGEGGEHLSEAFGHAVHCGNQGISLFLAIAVERFSYFSKIHGTHRARGTRPRAPVVPNIPCSIPNISYYKCRVRFDITR